MNNIRNLAIIAHVDHGKTTLIDGLLRQAQKGRSLHAIGDRVMDTNDLEKERGITILAKCTGLSWNNTHLNIIDTPGHADFGGEVERILSIVDGVLLLVDAAEGPMPQTKFVTQKALSLNLKPIIIINKIDKPNARPEWVIDQIFDLFIDLNATEDQIDFNILFTSAKEGWAITTLQEKKKDFSLILDHICRIIPPPKILNAPFSCCATILEHDAYLGRLLTGKILSGHISVGDIIKSLTPTGKFIENIRVTKLLTFDGLSRVSIDQAHAGEIIIIAGAEKTTVSDTLCAPSVTAPIKSIPITPPTMWITIGINTSPLMGLDGKKLTSQMIEERLLKELERNIAIEVSPTSSSKEVFEVRGRGELQLGILIETMRREGFELTIGPPQILFKYENNIKMEPIEELQIDVDEQYSGVVIEKLTARKGVLSSMTQQTHGKIRLVFFIPSRGLIGYQSVFLSDTRGTGILARLFHKYESYRGDIPKRREGVLISGNTGKAVAYALWNLEERGTLFITSGMDVYEGMIIGEHRKNNDLIVNPLKSKQLTNMRASGKDEAVTLTPCHNFSLEEAIAYIAEDECVEVTPNHIRLRKYNLKASERKMKK